MNTDSFGRTMVLMPIQGGSFAAVPWAHRRMKTFEVYDRDPSTVTRYAYARLPHWAWSPTWGVPDPFNVLIGVRDFQPRVYGKSVKGAGTEGWVIVAPSLITPPSIRSLAQPLYPAFTAAGTIRLMTLIQIDQRWWCDWWDPEIESPDKVTTAEDIVVAWWPRAHGSTAYAVASTDYQRWVTEAQELPDPTFITRDSFMTSTPAFLELLRRSYANKYGEIWTPGFSSNVMLWGPGTILRQPLEIQRFDERVPGDYRKLGLFAEVPKEFFDDWVFGPVAPNVWRESEEIIAEAINGRVRDLKQACPHPTLSSIYSMRLVLESAKATEWLLAWFASRVYATPSVPAVNPTEARKTLAERQRLFRFGNKFLGVDLAEKQAVDYTIDESQVRRVGTRGANVLENKVTGRTVVLEETSLSTPDEWYSVFLIALEGLCANPAFAETGKEAFGSRTVRGLSIVQSAEYVADQAMVAIKNHRQQMQEGKP